MASPTDLALQSLGGVYRDPQRVSRDADTLLSRPEGYGLKVKVSTLVQNSGEEIRLVCLGGTIGIAYGGTRYNIPVDIYLPPPYPLKPPHCYVRPVSTMILKPGHRHVDRQGLVYMPYLHEWRPHKSNLVNMVISMAGIFEKDPPVYAKPAEAAPDPPPMPAQTSQPPPPPPSYDTVGTTHGFAAAASSLQSIFKVGQKIATGSKQSDRLTAAELRAQVTQKLRMRVQAVLEEKREKAQESMKDQANLEHGRKELIQKMDRLKSMKSVLSENIEHATAQNDKLRQYIEEIEGKGETSIDDAIIPVDVASGQILNLMSENHCIEDAIYHLDRALNNGTIAIDEHLKEVRKLSRKQFLSRAHFKKITTAPAINSF